MKNNFSRREFILTGAAAASGLAAFGFPASSAMDLTFNKSDTLRLGLIGSGSRGSGIASLLKEIPGVELVACCDLLPEHLQRGMSFAAKGAKAYTDYRQMLNDKSIHAVIIATPLYLHHQMALDALEMGKHIYMEKTMAYNIPQTLEMVRKVKGSNLVFQVGHQYRYYELYHKINEVVKKGWCGDITHFECQYHQNSDWRRPVSDPKLEKLINWRMYREYSGGVMAELCAHQIDIVNWILASHPLKVTGLGGINYWKDGRETYDHVRTIFEYPGGIQSSVTSVLSNGYKGYSIRILGTKATIEIQREKAFIYSEPEKVERGVVDGISGATKKAWPQGEAVPIAFKGQDEPTQDPTIFAILDFADCIRNNRKPASNVETGRDVALAVHMGNLAMREEKVQHWKPEYSV